MIPNDASGPLYQGLNDRWHIFPLDLSLTKEGSDALASAGPNVAWWTIEEILDNVTEPNVCAIARQIRQGHPEMLREVHAHPSMEAMAGEWAARNPCGVRAVRARDIDSILAAGSRAFNLRVADPYLPYQSQGLGFTWSFFTPNDKQDVHVHGMPAVEMYGVIRGRLQIWHKPMNQRGVTAWRSFTLEAGDWAEVEPLHCHFACWEDPAGLGTVIKAAATGELAGVGKLGEKGKTTCPDCPSKDQCAHHPRMCSLMEEYAKPFGERKWERIASLTREPDLPV